MLNITSPRYKINLIKSEFLHDYLDVNFDLLLDLVRMPKCDCRFDLHLIFCSILWSKTKSFTHSFTYLDKII